MKPVIVLLLTGMSFSLCAQNNVLFEIVTLSYGVNIDGDAIGVGQHITGASKNISIPKNGCQGVITNNGFAHELHNSIAVAEVNDFVIRNRPEVGAKHRPSPIPLTIPLNPRSKRLSGDTLFLTWEEDLVANQAKGI